VRAKDGAERKYLVPLSKHILVQNNDFVRAGVPLSDGAITPSDILAIKGPTAVQEYLVNEIQDVYRLQGVKINDKHIESIVRQMMQKVIIDESGDTMFLNGQNVDRFLFREENDKITDQKVVMDAGDSDRMKVGMIVSARALRDENSSLKRRDLKIVTVRDAEPAVSHPNLQGITQASLGTDSFISAASFQETTKVLSEASIRAKADTLDGLKENVIVGHLIPAGTGVRKYLDYVITSKEELQQVEASKDAKTAEKAGSASYRKARWTV
jgi:DNA-directed RNA polymerase subunit beta'